MQNHSFRNSVVTGTYTLPATAVAALLLWTLPTPADWRLWVGLAATGLTTLLIMELNNRNALLRVRSRMISATYLTLMLACPALHAWSAAAVPAFCLTLSYAALFASYQRARAEGYIYHAFLFAGIGSVVFPPMLGLAALFYVHMFVQLRNLNWRTFAAGLLGAATPYWIGAAWAVWQNRLDAAAAEFAARAMPQLPDYSCVSTQQWVTLATLCLFALPAFAHFMHTAYNDKIRTRMLFYIIATQEVVTAAGFALFPDRFDEVMRLFILNSSFLLAHHLTLAKGRFFHVWFYVSLLAAAALGAYNYLFT